jgi:hypothetical protein
LESRFKSVDERITALKYVEDQAKPHADTAVYKKKTDADALESLTGNTTNRTPSPQSEVIPSDAISTTQISTGKDTIAVEEKPRAVPEKPKTANTSKRAKNEDNISVNRPPNSIDITSDELNEFYYSSSTRPYYLTLEVSPRSSRTFGFVLINDSPEVIKMMKENEARLDKRINLQFPFGEKIRSGQAAKFYINLDNISIENRNETYRILIPTKKSGGNGNTIAFMISLNFISE